MPYILIKRQEPADTGSCQVLLNGGTVSISTVLLTSILQSCSSMHLSSGKFK